MEPVLRLEGSPRPAVGVGAPVNIGPIGLSDCSVDGLNCASRVAVQLVFLLFL